MFTFRKKHFLIALILFMVELYIVLDVRDAFVRPYLGDFLVVILQYCFFRAFLNRRILSIAMGVLLFSYFIEITQYYGLIYSLGWEHSFLAHMVLGSTFKWLDMLAYTLGIAVVVIFEEVRFTKPATREIILKAKA